MTQMQTPTPSATDGKRVAVIGAGPAGLMAAEVLAAHGLANMPLDKISDRLETAKKGAEVGLTEIMLERSGDIGSSVVEHEILIRSGSAAKEGD